MYVILNLKMQNLEIQNWVYFIVRQHGDGEGRTNYQDRRKVRKIWGVNSNKRALSALLDWNINVSEKYLGGGQIDPLPP